VRRYHEAARIAEAAKFDTIFLADSLALRDAPLDALARSTHFTACLDPLMVLASLAEHTRHIGLVATASTTYNNPYDIARKFASLDHISGGRAGWNLVTSTQEMEARNFSQDAHLKHADRYARAGEFIDVVKGLWDGWADDAVILDKQRGLVFDPAKVRPLNHQGEHFSVRGPLNSARPPQGHPVIFQAGSSEPGKALAARTADCIFTGQPTLARAKAFYADVKGRLAQYGRGPEDLKILPALFPIVGETEAQAQAKFQHLQDLVDPVDGPIPDLPETEGNKSVQARLLDQARIEDMTIRDLYLRYAAGFGNRPIIGAPKQIADEIEESFEAGAVDGFAISSPFLPGSLKDFATMVVPELQRRGLFRTEYGPGDLRSHLGLRRPERAAAD
jgi:alkanesulfonate monooxygenase SsuD/methylene tetrahydromethanopterin reductase-like flavin-dependent oxidoreductase (luciferase family)